MHIEKLDYNLHSILIICIVNKQIQSNVRIIPIKSRVNIKSCDNTQHTIDLTF
jgi:hypothetical protein